MKIVKEMLMHLGTMFEKSDTRRAYSALLTPYLELQLESAASIERLRSQTSLFLTKLHPSGLSDS